MPSAALQRCRTRRLVGGRLLVRISPLFMLSTSKLRRLSETWILNTIAGTLWSLGRLNARPPQLLALLTARIEQLLPGTTVKEVGTAMSALWRLQYKPKSPSLLPALMKRALVSGPDLCVLLERPLLSCARPVNRRSTVSSSVTTCCSDLPVPQEGVHHMSVQTLANVSAALARLPVEPQTRPLAIAIAAEFCLRDHTGDELPKPEEVSHQLG